MRIFLFVIFLFFNSIISAQKQAETVIAVKTPDSKYRFEHPKTRIAVDDMLYDEAEAFVNGFARVLKNKKFSFVDKAGKLIAPVEFDAARNFRNKLAAVEKDGKWGFIDDAGKIIIDLKYKIAFDFELAAITVVFDNKNWYLLSNKGQATELQDVYVCYGFKNGVAKVARENREGILYPDGKIIWNSANALSANPISWHPNVNSLAVPCPDNLGFEYGDFTNWNCFAGDVDSVGTTNVITVTPTAPIPNRHTVYPRAMPSAIDPFGLFPLNPPDGSNFAVQLGNTNVGAEAERISYTIHVPLNDSNFSIKYDYAVVFEDPGHTMWTQPRFISRLIDSATNTSIDCASFEYIATSGLPGFKRSPVDTSVMFKDWASVFYSLRGYGGQTLYLEFTTADCVRTGHWGYAYVDVQSTCGSPVEVHYDCLPPNATTLTAPPGFEFYNWWNFDYSILLGTGQQLNMNPGPSLNSVIWVEMIPFSSFGCQDTLKVNINGDFDAVFDNSTATGCAPQTFTFYNRNLPSSSVTWDFGDGNTATGDTVTHTYNLPGNYNVTMDVIMPGGCHGNAIRLITIYPIPAMVKPANLVSCNQVTTSTVNFTATPPGTVFNWINDNPSIGLPASGTGNIAAFTAINNGSVPVTANITVTPTHLTCTGAPEVFTITVNPSPDVVQPANQLLCNNTATDAVTFSGTLGGTSFNWTNNNTSIGLPASGSGDIPAFTAINASSVNSIATIRVTPFDGICPGTPRIFTITVKPTPNVVQPTSQILCNTTATIPINFTSAVSGSSFNWNNNNTSIGLAGGGIGNIPSFIAVNPVNTPILALISVAASANGCMGPAQDFTITVNPTPDVTQPASQVLCNATATNAVNFTGLVSNTTFTWTNDNTSIGLAAGGTGDIPSFTATNLTNAPVTANITVTPSASGCPGSAKSFTITVNPTPTVVPPADQALCNGSATSAVNFTGAVSGSNFNWSNNNTAIGLAGGGNGDIPSFFAVNPINTQITGLVSVAASANGCQGPAQNFTITVYPTPDVVQPPDQTLCGGSTTNAINFSGAVTNTIFSWTNNNTSIGLAAAGTGDIPSFTAINITNAPVTATITVTASANGCPGAARSFTISVNPAPNVAQPANQIVCNASPTNAINFTGAVSGTGFSWTNDNTSIGLGASGTGDISSFTAINVTNAPVTATVSVTPLANGCPGPAQTFTITVNPTPNVLQPANQALCNASATNAVNFSSAVSGTGFSWINNNPSIGLAANGNGNIPSFTATNLTNAPVTATITVSPMANGCPGPSQTFTITVNPAPNVAQPANQSLCNGSTTNAVNFTGAVSGTGFSWTNNNTSIGLAAGGTGDIPSFTALNLTNAAEMATIIVSPLANGCPGPAQSFTITVNPTPNVQQPVNQTTCNGYATNAINFTGAVTSTSFSWTNNNTSIGLAASGTGNIPSFTAANATNTPVTATITVSPLAGGCPGPAQSFTITVNPAPDVAQPANQVVCNSSATNAVNFTGAVNNTSFTWTNNNTSIGLAASGTGDIPSFTAINVTNAPVTATITVTPLGNGCPGAAKSFTITVNPTPNVVQPANQALCNGSATSAVNFTGNISGTSFNWSNSNAAIGLAGSGIGDIPTFTAINLTNSQVMALISVAPFANGCQGPVENFTITVYPTPDVVQPADQSLCNGAATNAINFSGTVTNTIFSWTNNNTAIGLAAAGTGDIPSFTAINITNVPVTATITITPSANGCPGTTRSFTITVNPTPNVAQPANQVLCNASPTNAINFTGAVSGTGFSWTNNNTSIGLAAGGTGDIASFTAINITNAPVTATISVTPSVNGCTGITQSFIILVNPTAAVAQPASQALCNNSQTNTIGFAGPVSGTAFSWTNDNTSIGLAASGTGDIPSFTAINATNAPVTATITVAASANGCPGSTRSFTITVNPTPDVAQPADQRICDGFATSTINFSAAVAGTGFNWTNSNPAIGLSSSGTGNITSFTGVNKGAAPVNASIEVTPVARGCAGLTKTIVITVDPNPTVELGNDLNLSTGTITSLNAAIQNGPISTWAWTPATGLSCTNCPSPMLTVTNNITYGLTVTNVYGCIARDNISISTFCKNSQVFVPNAFTPDGDGLNDILMVRGTGIFVKSFRIFNRWGELVFQKTNFNPNDKQYGWDGKVRGVAASPDVFVYTAEVVCDNGVNYTYKGNTTLLK